MIHKSLLGRNSRLWVSLETLSAEDHKKKRMEIHCFRCLHVFVMDEDDARTLSFLDLGFGSCSKLWEQVNLWESFESKVRCVLGYFRPSLERKREIGRGFRVVVLVGIKGDTRDICMEWWGLGSRFTQEEGEEGIGWLNEHGRLCPSY